MKQTTLVEGAEDGEREGKQLLLFAEGAFEKASQYVTADILIGQPEQWICRAA